MYKMSNSTINVKVKVQLHVKFGTLMVHWHPVPVANQLLTLITKLATYLYY